MSGEAILNTANRIIHGERAEEYGSASDCFERIANLWSAYLGYRVDSADVGHMMILFKIARTQGGKYKADNYVDIAGYAALTAELSESPEK